MIEEINVKDFGAQGDGAHPDTHAIQLALDAASQVLGTIHGTFYGDCIRARVFVPPGIYSITGTLKIPRYVEFLGDGMSTTILKHEGGNKPCIEMLEDGSGGMFANTVRDLTIRGKKGARANSTTVGIHGKGCYFNCLIERVRIFHCNIGIHLERSWSFTLENSHIHDCAENCLKWEDANNGMMYSNRFSDAGEHCVHIKSTTVALYAAANSIQKAHKAGLFLEGVHSANLYGNYFEGNSRPKEGLLPGRESFGHLDIRAGGDNKERNYLIQGGYFSPGEDGGPRTIGINIEKARHVHISGVYMWGDRRMPVGIKLGAGVENASLFSNTIDVAQKYVLPRETTVFHNEDEGATLSSGGLSILQRGNKKALYVVQGDEVQQAILASNTSQLFRNVAVLSDVHRPASASFRFFEGRSDVSGSPDTEFRVSGDGNVSCDGSFYSGGADYAEYFEWEDGNPGNEDRVGISVVIEQGKIRPAVDGNHNDEIIGVITANPIVAGDGAELKWHKRYLKDEFNRPIFEEYRVPVDEDQSSDREADQESEYVTLKRKEINPDYDSTAEYVPRGQRKEWASVCLLGKVRVRNGQPTRKTWIKIRDISKSVSEYLVR